MTNTEQPQDITQRLASIDEQLEQLGDEIDLIRTIQNANRRETRANSQTAARLERTVAQLADIARDHQQALRISQQNFDRIWEYLLRQSGNGNSPPPSN
jgi:predicted metalloenzyme YecM